MELTIIPVQHSSEMARKHWSVDEKEENSLFFGGKWKKRYLRGKQQKMRNNNTDCIRFDWAIKRILRDKANFGVLEGLMTVLIGEGIRILEILESESNQDSFDGRKVYPSVSSVKSPA